MLCRWPMWFQLRLGVECTENGMHIPVTKPIKSMRVPDMIDRKTYYKFYSKIRGFRIMFTKLMAMSRMKMK